jgi:hypothetical protein
MTKRLLVIYLVLVVLIALLVPSCAGGGTGTIYVQATLCGVPWQGAVNYTLTSAAAGTAPISGTTVPASHSVDAGTWTCAYVGGGPAGTYPPSITPSATQTLSANSNITFTLNFELNEDAAIKWLTWTIDGEPWQTPTLETMPCHIIDAHFQQWVNGCVGYNVTMNETSELYMKWVSYTGDFPGAAGVVIYVINDDCAVNKTPAPQGLPPVKKSQVASFNGTPVKDKYTWFEWPVPGIGQNVTLDVETIWQLVKCVNYTKSINLFGISKTPFDPGMEHNCVLFELVFQAPGAYTFQLTSSAKVVLVDETDVNPANNQDMSPLPPLTLTVTVGP